MTEPATSVSGADRAFPTDPAGLAPAAPPAVIRFGNGDHLPLRIGPVAKRIGDDVVRMLAYGGSIPGPVIHGDQGAELQVDVTNEGDTEATVHWHGLRLENRFDGVPHETQLPIPVGGNFSYTLQFPDPGFYWYHPHIRRTTAWRWGSTGRSSWSRATRATGHPPTAI